MGRRGATLNEVAEHAGVSIATASRALSGDHPMSDRTRAKVLDAVREVGYQRDRRTRHTAALVAVVTTRLGHMAIAEVVAGVEDVSSGEGAKCSLTLTHADPDKELAVLDELAGDDRIGAVIVIGGIHAHDRWRSGIRAVAGRLHAREIPLVFCGRGLTELNIPGLSVLDYDGVGGAKAVVSLLLGRGHRVIGSIGGEPGFSTADQRQQGYRSALESFGVEVDPELSVRGPRQTSFGVQALAELLRRRPEVTAVFAETDALAQGVLHGAHQLGIGVPQDLSVVGFDDQPGAEVFVPSLTTVHMPFADLGRRAARVALGIDHWAGSSGILSFGTHVVLRESVGAPRSGPIDLDR